MGSSILHGALFCERIAPFVERIACVTFDPMEFYGVCGIELIELHPEFLIEHGLAVSFFPAVRNRLISANGTRL